MACYQCGDVPCSWPGTAFLLTRLLQSCFNSYACPLVAQVAANSNVVVSFTIPRLLTHPSIWEQQLKCKYAPELQKLHCSHNHFTPRCIAMGAQGSKLACFVL